MNLDQFRCIKTLAETLKLQPAELLAFAGQVAGQSIAVVFDLDVDQAHALIDVLAAIELPRRKPNNSERTERKKKERA